MSHSENVNNLTADEIREAVRDNYGKVAERDGEGGCCGTSTGCGTGSACCAPGEETEITVDAISAALGYSPEELAGAPDGANLGLGCGNPQAIASLKPGETVLDLGSGAGFDSFLAARTVGPQGTVIGVDMTPQMIKKARENARKVELNNVVFRLGEIENIPVADNTVDAIISNCVINLSPEKEQVFREAFRVLRGGGRLAISDVVATADLPTKVRENLSLYTGCVGGAAPIGEITEMLSRAGFTNIAIKPKDESREFIREWVPGSNLSDYITSATIEAIKPVAN